MRRIALPLVALAAWWAAPLAGLAAAEPPMTTATPGSASAPVPDGSVLPDARRAGVLLVLAEARFSGGDGDGVPEPGERLLLSVVLANVGDRPARDVRGTVTVSGEGVGPVRAAVAWGDIPPGESRASSEAIAVSIPRDPPRATACGADPGSGGPGSAVGAGAAEPQVSGHPPALRDGDAPASPGGGRPVPTVVVTASPEVVSSDTPEPSHATPIGPILIDPGPGALAEPGPGTEAPVPLRAEIDLALDGARIALRHELGCDSVLPLPAGGAEGPALTVAERPRREARPGGQLVPGLAAGLVAALAVAFRVARAR
jgi:hypothetical protein